MYAMRADTALMSVKVSMTTRSPTVPSAAPPFGAFCTQPVSSSKARAGTRRIADRRRTPQHNRVHPPPMETRRRATQAAMPLHLIAKKRPCQSLRESPQPPPNQRLTTSSAASESPDTIHLIESDRTGDLGTDIPRFSSLLDTERATIRRGPGADHDNRERKSR